MKGYINICFYMCFKFLEENIRKLLSRCTYSIFADNIYSNTYTYTIAYKMCLYFMQYTYCVCVCIFYTWKKGSTMSRDISNHFMCDYHHIFVLFIWWPVSVRAPLEASLSISEARRRKSLPHGPSHGSQEQRRNDARGHLGSCAYPRAL